jgi:hypothetical protein
VTLRARRVEDVTVYVPNVSVSTRSNLANVVPSGRVLMTSTSVLEPGSMVKVHEKLVPGPEHSPPDELAAAVTGMMEAKAMGHVNCVGSTSRGSSMCYRASSRLCKKWQGHTIQPGC